MPGMAIEHIGPRIREGRERKGLTQEALGDLVGTSGNQVSKWERNEVTPDTPSLLAAADALDQSLDWIAGRDIRNEDPDGLRRFLVEVVPTLREPPTEAECVWLRTSFRNLGDPTPDEWARRLREKRRGLTAAQIKSEEAATRRAQAKYDAARAGRK